MRSKQPIVSIIIPFYNAKNTLAFCLKSLSDVSYKNLQFIFIDDCSVDNGATQVEEFLAKQSKDKSSILIRHSVNMGVASARNTGLDHAIGEYILYVDADDKLAANAIGKLVDCALTNHADIVGFNWYLEFETNKRKMPQPKFQSPREALENMINGTMRWNLWIFLVKRALYEDNNIRFLPGMNMGEDLMVMIKLFASAENVVYADKYFYHYRQSNKESLTKTYSEAHMQQVSENLNEAIEFLKDTIYWNDLAKFTHYLKLNIKLPLLISPKYASYRRWLTWFSESNRYAGKNPNISWRTRMLEHCAYRRYFFAIKLYYYVVIRVVYGIIYK
ncbi:glycosyltransferase family 2 protein [Sphingobacterium corticis]|uniref:Glycosyltransferase family 2 protein n=1 Tax=Sphingobacterium corticis TaxID=1812823 RepID=A0ABW5NHZ0_9SPHI